MYRTELIEMACNYFSTCDVINVYELNDDYYLVLFMYSPPEKISKTILNN